MKPHDVQQIISTHSGGLYIYQNSYTSQHYLLFLIYTFISFNRMLGIQFKFSSVQNVDCHKPLLNTSIVITLKLLVILNLYILCMYII